MDTLLEPLIAARPEAEAAPPPPTRGGATGMATGAALIREFLTFKLGAEEYGIDILRVREIRSYEPPTRIAKAPSFIKGVLNLRGAIMPIVDMRLKFRLPQARYDDSTVVIVLNIAHRIVGMVVDGVNDVIALERKQLHPVPAFDAAIAAEHLLAIGAVDGRMLILLDVEKLMSSPEMGLLDLN
jgi:purine-binding chemotaxis protein CheW